MEKRIKAWVGEHEQGAFAFLRDLIGIHSTSCHEGGVVARIIEEMEILNFDEVKVDAMGNVHGRVGSGPRVIAYDGHIDTVDVGARENWGFDPLEGMEDEQYIYGRGASDQTGGFISAVYAAALLKELDLLKYLTVWVVGTVQEEDCDGLCWQHILNEKVITPECVVLTEPTSLGVYRGHRGRMEIKVAVHGVSAHGSAPERGDNAIYKMARILTELEGLNEVLKADDFLGKGTLVVSEIFSSSPSRCAVADECRISIDRRLTAGETPESAIEEIKALPSVKAAKADVSMYHYESASYKGLVQNVPCMFPTWTLPEADLLVQKMAGAHSCITGEAARIDKWTFSTNGVAIMGMKGIPCIGYGPGDEVEAHAPNEKIRKSDIRTAIGTYSCFAATLTEG